MMEFEVGGIYKIVRKPLNRVKLYERKSDAGRHYYKYSMNAKILVISRAEKISRRRGQRCVAYFFKSSEIEHFVECFYGVWIKNMHLIKKERDISKWPHLARKHFLMAKGASVEAAIEGTLEDAHRQIANVARKTRLDKENRERQVKQAFDFDLSLKKNSTEMMYVTVDSSTTTGEITTPSRQLYGTTHEMTEENPHDYGDYTDEEWKIADVNEDSVEIEFIAPPVHHSEPLPAPTGLAPGYMKQAKKRGKKLAKKKRKKKNQIEKRQNRLYGFEDEEIRNTIKETKIKMEKKRSSFNAWYSDQTGKKEETE